MGLDPGSAPYPSHIPHLSEDEKLNGSLVAPLRETHEGSRSRIREESKCIDKTQIKSRARMTRGMACQPRAIVKPADEEESILEAENAEEEDGKQKSGSREKI